METTPVSGRNQNADELLAAIKKYQEALQVLEQTLVRRATEQYAIEQQYNSLVKLARDGIEFVCRCQVGDVISEDWVAKRDELLARAHEIVSGTAAGS
ncbi:MAG: hypothetical protein JOZ18_11835 [Chloroflexi bacterium]|nr:hypothetical protein [Chloroflexota bacterium]